MEDFYFLERADGTEASGKIAVGGKTVSFYAWSYGGHYRVNVDGVEYPSIQIGDNQVEYAFPGTATKAYEREAMGGKWPDKVHPPEGDPSAFIATRLENLCREAYEQPEMDVPAQIAAKMDDEELDDEDEFEPDRGASDILFHVVNGKKIWVREIIDEPGHPADAPSAPEIKKLDVVRELPDPPLPKGLHRTSDAYWENPKTNRYEEKPGYKPPWAES